MACDQCWILGDMPAGTSFEQHFKLRKSTDYNSYIKAHFDVSGLFHSNVPNSLNPSVLARFASLMTNAVQSSFDGKLLPLPKLVVVVADDNLIQTISDSFQSVSKAYSRIINFIMTEFERCVASFKENLPARCIKNVGYPNFLWIQA